MPSVLLLADLGVALLVIHSPVRLGLRYAAILSDGNLLSPDIRVSDRVMDENAVVAAVCTHLSNNGYAIIQRLSTTNQGIDVIAKHPSNAGRLLIEARRHKLSCRKPTLREAV